MINVLTDLKEMARVGIMKGNIDIQIWTDDAGMIPRFHFYERDKKDDNEGCIRIDKPEYFPHGGKNAKLGSSQRKELVKFLNSKHKSKKMNLTNWEFLIQMWNSNNSEVEVDEDLPMPNYRMLK